MDFTLSRCPRETRKSRSKNSTNSTKENVTVCEHRGKIRTRKRKRVAGIPIPRFHAEGVGLKRLDAKELPELQSRILFRASTNLSEFEDDEAGAFLCSAFTEKAPQESSAKENKKSDPLHVEPTGTSSRSPGTLNLGKTSRSNSNLCTGVSPNQQALMSGNNEKRDSSSPARLGKPCGKSDREAQSSTAVSIHAQDEGERGGLECLSFALGANNVCSVLDQAAFAPLIVNNDPIEKTAVDEVQELQLNIDSIFSHIDVKGATVKSFQRALQTKLGRPLMPMEKRFVKARLGDLVNKRVLPNASSSERYEKTSIPPVTSNSSSSKLANSSSRREDGLKKSWKTEVSLRIEQSSPVMDPKNSSTKTRKSYFDHFGDSTTREENVTPPRRSDNDQVDTANDQGLPSRFPFDPNSSEGGMVPRCTVAQTTTTRKDISRISQFLPKKVSTILPNCSSDTFECGFVEATVSVSDMPKSGIRTENPVQHSPPVVESQMSSAATSKAKAAKSRRQVRKGSCALCTTCQCKNVQSFSTGSKLADFALSNSASEKALIRRAQRLEKSSENIENQIEIIQRKLKQLRRDVWKKKEQEKGSASSNKEDHKERFLCDAKVFDSEQMQSKSLTEAISINARKALFPDTPCFQPTLTQMLGAPSKRSFEKTDELSAAELPQSMKEEVNDLHKSELDATEDELSDDRLALYTKETLLDRNPKRMEWSLVRSSKKPESEVECSFWRALRVDACNVKEGEHLLPSQFSQPHDILDDRSHSSLFWDEMFTADNMNPTLNQGISQLASIFEDSGIPWASEEYSSNGNCTASPGTPDSTVKLSQLTQRGKEFATEIICEISKEDNKLNLLQQSCPNWKENVAYVMKKDSKEEISAALQEVRQRQERMIEAKKIVLQGWQRQFCALEVFQKCLLSSLGRFEV